MNWSIAVCAATFPAYPERAAQGIVAIAVSKIPTKNEFFRTHATFRPTVKLVNIEVGMEQQYFAVTPAWRFRCTASASALRNTRSI